MYNTTMSKAYIVGGAVRDVLLGRKPKDLDYVWVGMTPEDMLKLGFEQVGADFPVFLDNDGNEHALARKERKVASGYNGFETDFDTSVTLEDDLKRRDLTVNAMAVEANWWEAFKNNEMPDVTQVQFLVDPFNGRHDLEAGILRHVSKAFAEDPVRVLRVARFAARYKFDIALDTVALMGELVETGELDTLVPERVWAETEKALGEKNPMAYFRTLEMCHANQILFPELKINGFLESSLQTDFTDSKLRFALMCLKMNEITINNLCERLKVPNDYRQLAVRSSHFVNTLREELTPESVVRVLEAVGAFQDPENLDNVLLVAFNSAYNTKEFFNRMTTIAIISPDVCSVRFADLSQEQQETLKGPEIGKALRELRVSTVKQALI